MKPACALLLFLGLLLISPAVSKGTSDKPKLQEQKSGAKWSLLQSAARAALPDSYQRTVAYQTTIAADMRCFQTTVTANDGLELNSTSSLVVNSTSSLVASMFLKVATDGGWITDFDEDFWLNNPIQPGTEDDPRTFLALKFNNFTVEARMTHGSELEIVLPSGVHAELTYFPVGKWLKLDLELDSKGKINVKVGSSGHVNSYPVFGGDTNSSEVLDEDEQQESHVNSSSKMDNNGSAYDVALNKTHLIPSEVCYIDEASSKKPWLNIARLEISLVSKYDASVKCETPLNATLTLYKQIMTDSQSRNSLCKDEFSLIVLPSTISYFDHDQQCKKLQGSILSKDDVGTYINELFKIASATRTTTDENLSWVQSLNITSESFRSWCSLLLRNVTVQMRPCYFSLPSSICKVQTSLPFFLFGKIGKFSRKYTLISKPDGTWAIKGFSSIMRYNKTEWILLSNLHKESCHSNSSNLPLVRSSWQCGEVSNLTLAFSSCGPDSFSCNSGQCLTRKCRCDGIAQCDDETDEEMCDFIIKDAGYNDLIIPPPLEDETKFRAKYFFKVYSIAPIQTSNFYVDVDLVFGVHWMDPRLTIWNPSDALNFDCKKIWYPSYAATNGFPIGHWVSMPDKRTEGCMVSLFPGMTLKESDDNPYMGRYLNGSSFELVYTLGGVLQIPCEFDLRKYPFGDQTCELNIWIDVTDQDYVVYERFDSELQDEVPFYGRYDVREYKVSRTWKKEVNSNKSVSLFIKFKSLYGYHVLNSYLTSFLIVLISFSTALFRVEDFNERVMVSLTALLVLTALFTQSNSSSVQTSYLKLLDVWYAALISFSFLVVLANTLLNSYHHKLNADKTLGKKCYDEMTIKKKAKVMNNIIFGFLDTLFLFFMFFYLLSIADKI
ncbi:Low-density lipoprotein (LDL) receptor class A repeat [Trinorchestia longiramus]|nr:Low-density lipoprotein (LDL) receptor class A repeat [Trinorchestia longiramus]